MLRGGDREVFLAAEMMEEAALGHAGGGAQVVDGRRRIALAADHRHRGVEDALARRRDRVACRGTRLLDHQQTIPTGRYGMSMLGAWAFPMPLTLAPHRRVM